MANRFAKGTALGILTTHLWEKDSTILRWIESRFLDGVLAYRRRMNIPSPPEDSLSVFLRPEPTLAKPSPRPRSWYTRYSLTALRFTGGASLVLFGVLGRTSRRLFNRAIEGKEARAARLKRSQEIDETLKAERRSGPLQNMADPGVSSSRVS